MPYHFPNISDYSSDLLEEERKIHCDKMNSYT